MTVEAIERLRAAKPHEKFKPTLDQVRTIVNGLQGVMSLSDITALLDLPETDHATEQSLNAAKDVIRHDGIAGVRQVQEWLVLSIVAELGTWLTHVSGGAEVDTTDAIDGIDADFRQAHHRRKHIVSQDQGVLFQTFHLVDYTTTPPDIIRQGKRKVAYTALTALEQAKYGKFDDSIVLRIEAETALNGEDAARAIVELVYKERQAREELRIAKDLKKANAQEVYARKQVAAAKVQIPVGFERAAWHHRDLKKALAMIVVANPDDETLNRFISRKYPTQAKIMTFPLVSAIWFFAKLGRLEEVDLVNPKNATFNELVVEAYDLLDIARKDANDGIKTLVKMDTSDLIALADACVKAKWVAEGEIGKIERLVQAAVAREASLPILVRELGFFRQRVFTNPKRYFPETIQDLNAGNVLRIAAKAGLDVENEDRSDEAEVRNRLKELGFHADLDQLVPTGVKAIRLGRSDDFYEAMNARKDGNSEWPTLLAEVLEGANA